MTNTQRSTIEAVIGITGFVLLGVYGNWGIAIAVFLMLWGNNVQHSRRNEHS